MTGKPLIASKTVWLNLIAGLPVAADAIMQIMTQVQPILPTAWLPTYTAVLAILNIILRLRTTQPIVSAK